LLKPFEALIEGRLRRWATRCFSETMATGGWASRVSRLAPDRVSTVSTSSLFP
jgi:hypothetical protein